MAIKLGNTRFTVFGKFKIGELDVEKRGWNYG
ncbi:hypothetical protein J2756_000650 [Methanobacterium aggregans]|nr:hypothetical protein [Methanobacterium aggregans]